MHIVIFDQNEHVDGHDKGQNEHEVQNCSPGQNDSKWAALVLEQFVLQWGETSKVRAVLDLVQAFGTAMNGSLGETDQEWHED